MSDERIPAPAAAIRAQLTQEQLRRRVARGEIKGFLIDGKYYVEARSLATWIDEHRAAAPA